MRYSRLRMPFALLSAGILALSDFVTQPLHIHVHEH